MLTVDKRDKVEKDELIKIEHNKEGKTYLWPILLYGDLQGAKKFAS